MNGLVLVNFILIIIVLAGMIVLYRRQERLEKRIQNNEEINQQFTGQMEEFLAEIQDENERFIREFSKLIEQRTDSLPRENMDTHESFQLKPNEINDEISSENKTIETSPENGESVIEHHQQDVDQIAAYLQEGYTVEEIAKILNRGKTEIELLVKFTPALMNIYARNVQK